MHRKLKGHAERRTSFWGYALLLLHSNFYFWAAEDISTIVLLDRGRLSPSGLLAQRGR